MTALLPGIALASALAVAANMLAPLIAPVAPVPALVLALVIGIWLHPLAARALFAPGLRFCVSTILRIAVALLGLRVALGDIVALGLTSALIIMVAMAATISVGLWLATFFGLSRGFGALAGVATGVCGASAALATSSVLPNYQGKEADTVFVIVAVNLLSTIAMVAYPQLAQVLGLHETATGILLGGTIHDVAQVVGAGYAVSDTVGASAVIVKLFRVLLLLPVILIVGRLFASSSQAKVPVPIFAFVFLALCLLNSAMPLMPTLMPIYEPAKSIAGLVSTWGLLIAIAALGFNTSVTSIAKLGIRHMATVIGTTLMILIFVTGGLSLTQ
jgi:uncharacterized integral membrane protein (TIGR00698 family)